MSSLFLRNFGIFNARAFEYYVSAALTNLYVGIGRQHAWANGDTVPTPVESSNNYYSVWNNLIAAKKVTAADMNLVVPRIDWANGTTYVEYTQDLNLSSESSFSRLINVHPFKPPVFFTVIFLDLFAEYVVELHFSSV